MEWNILKFGNNDILRIMNVIFIMLIIHFVVIAVVFIIKYWLINQIIN